MKNHIALVNNHTLFVEGAVDRITAAQILEEKTNDSPLGLMFAGAGTLTIKFVEGHSVTVPYRKVRLTDPSVTVQNMVLEAEGTALDGVGIGLPDDVVRLHCAFKAAQDGVKGYNIDSFLKQYLGDLERIGTLFMDHVDTGRIDGVMAQVITDPRIGEDEVGISLTLSKKFHKALVAAGHHELEDAGHLDRMIVLLQRYPVVSQTGGRWVKLRVIKGAPADKILVNGVAWKELHDGDEDGDSGYIGINSKASFGEVERLPDYPDITVVTDDRLPEKKEADAVQTVMNMQARSLIGSQHTFFHGIARAAAVKVGRHGGKAAFDEKTREVFDIYHPMAEGVFDKRKDEGGGDSFNTLVWAMEDHLSGKTVMVEPFRPFLEDDALYQKFVDVMGEIGGSTRLARGTVFGRHLMGSSQLNAKKATFSFIVDALTGAGIEPLDMIAALQADGLGEKILPVEMPQQSSKQRVKPDEIKLTVNPDIEVIKDVFEGITLNGRQVLKIVGTETDEDGSMEVGVRLIPVWNPKLKSVLISIDWPSLTRVAGLPKEEHHRLLKMENMNTRMFCPIFKMVDGKIVLVDFELWFAHTLAEGIESFIKRMGSITKEKFQAHMDRHMRTAIRSLIMINDKDKDAGDREKLIRMFEYRVEVPGGTMSQKAEQYEEILTKLHEMGFDICTTSKNKPGTIVTKPWKMGVPRFIWAVNPFANEMDAKRKVEPREIRKALEFVNPIAPPLRTKGAKLPEVLGKVVTTLNVAVINLDELNSWIGTDGKRFCFDTLLVTASGIEKLQLKKLIFHADDAEGKAHIIQKLKNEGFDKIEVEETLESTGGGLHHVSYDIVAMKKEGIEDIGKIKACVGPIKGVMNPVPFKLFTKDGVEIDLIVPHDTIVRKRAVGAVNYMMAANAGMTEIDPDNQPELEVVKQTIVLEDGTELGEFITGPLPFFRPVQTGRSTADIRMGEHGIKVHTHTMIMAGGVDFHNTPHWVKEDFAQIVNTRKEVKKLIANRILSAQQEEAPMPTEAPEYVEA